MYEKLSETLKQHGYSLTQPRRALFSALQSGTPRTMRQLTLDLASVMDRASIYRNVDLFEELGIVTRLQTGWKYKIELSDLFSPHHHHITCTNCGKVVSFDEPDGFDTLLTQIALTHGYTAENHSLEITGRCRQCRSRLKA